MIQRMDFWESVEDTWANLGKVKREFMEYEETAYGKWGLSMTRIQIKKWNKIKDEMRYLAEHLADRSGWNNDQQYEKAIRLQDLIAQLPVFDADGKGYKRFGTNPERF